MGVIAGNDLALFIEKDGELSLIGFDLNCSISIHTSTKNISSKNSGKWIEKNVERLSWEVESEYLYTKESMNQLFEMMVSRSPLTLAFSMLRKTIYEFTYDDRHRFFGEAFITDLNGVGNMGSAGTLSIKLEGTGELKRFEATNKGIFENKFENKFE